MNKIDSHGRFSINDELCEVILPVNDGEKMLKHSHGSKSIEHSFVIYADFSTLILKAIPKSFGANKYIPCGFEMSIKYTYGDDEENKNFYYRDEDCNKRKCLKNIKFQTKRMKALTARELGSSLNADVCYVSNKKNQWK